MKMHKLSQKVREELKSMTLVMYNGTECQMRSVRRTLHVVGVGSIWLGVFQEAYIIMFDA